MSWRDVLAFVQSHDLAAISSSDPQPIDIYGVWPWQRDIITAAMIRLSEIVPFLARLPEKELRLLHERLGGFLSQKSIYLLSLLAAVTKGPLARKSLTGIAQLVGSSDPLDVARLAEDCQAYRADRHAEQALAQHRDTPVPPPELFLTLSNYNRPCSRLRAGLFELRLRAEPNPKAGASFSGTWTTNSPCCTGCYGIKPPRYSRSSPGSAMKIQEFVSWFLGKPHRYTQYFTGDYKFTSFVVYAYGRPRYAAWAKLGKEVQDAAMSLGIVFPEALRLPAMPDLEIPTQWSLVTSSCGISHRHLKRMTEQLSVRDQEKRDSNS